MPKTKEPPVSARVGVARESDWLTLEQAATLLGPGVTVRWVKERVWEGTLPVIRPTKRSTFIERGVVEAYRREMVERAGAA